MKQISFELIVIPKRQKQKQKRVNSSTQLVQLRKIGNCIFLQKHSASKLDTVI